MSLRLEMLQVARLSRRPLGESAENVIRFVASEYTNGAFKNRGGDPDLYYTVFALDCLQALAPDPHALLRADPLFVTSKGHEKIPTPPGSAEPTPTTLFVTSRGHENIPPPTAPPPPIPFFVTSEGHEKIPAPPPPRTEDPHPAAPGPDRVTAPATPSAGPAPDDLFMGPAGASGGGGPRDRSGSTVVHLVVPGPAGGGAVLPLQVELGDHGDEVVGLACRARVLGGAGRRALAASLLGLRRADGGFAAHRGESASTVYASFLALGALQDLAFPGRAEVTDAGALGGFVLGCATPDGGFALAPGLGGPTTPTTAAAVAVLRAVGVPAPAGTAAWLAARFSPRGGFCAAPGVAMPDLLSTAVALHALAILEVPLEPFREACLDFVDTLWSSRGGFLGHWADDALDCEYTFYGLLALGHLS